MCDYLDFWTMNKLRHLKPNLIRVVEANRYICTMVAQMMKAPTANPGRVSSNRVRSSRVTKDVKKKQHPLAGWLDII